MNHKWSYAERLDCESKGFSLEPYQEILKQKIKVLRSHHLSDLAVPPVKSSGTRFTCLFRAAEDKLVDHSH